MQPIRVMIVDDHAVVRSGLSAFLLAYDDLDIAGEAGGGREAVEACASMSPDVVLMDLVMPGMDGAAATAAIRATCPSVQVIALTSFPEENLVQAALAAGAMFLAVPLLSDAGRTVRINVSLDKGLVDQIDAAASARGLTRSAFLAQAAREKIVGSTS
jgi:DNA-binding NarL/FixJ family response regulator